MRRLRIHVFNNVHRSQHMARASDCANSHVNNAIEFNEPYTVRGVRTNSIAVPLAALFSQLINFRRDLIQSGRLVCCVSVRCRPHIIG